MIGALARKCGRDEPRREALKLSGPRNGLPGPLYPSGNTAVSSPPASSRLASVLQAMGVADLADDGPRNPACRGHVGHEQPPGCGGAG